MGRGTYLLVLFALCSSCHGRRALGSDDTYTVTGFFGCRFSSVCTDGEICIDDALFGNCQNPGRPQGVDQHQYQLTPDYLKLVIGQLENLVAQEYAWDNIYTQCVVGNLLLSYRVGEEPDMTFCDPESGEGAGESIDPEILALLQKLIDGYGEGRGDLVKREDERSEFVKVHKYLKERKSSLPESEVEKSLAGMSMKDLVEMKEYLSEMKDILEGGEAGTEVADSPGRGRTPEWMRDEREEQTSSWTPSESGANDGELSEEVEKKTSDFDADQSITPDEAKMIFDLVDGKELPPNLSETEIQRLTEAVATILQKVRNEQEDAAQQQQEQQEQQEQEQLLLEQQDGDEVTPVNGPGPLTAEQMTPGGDEENEGDASAIDEQTVEPESRGASVNEEDTVEPEEAAKRSENVVEVQKDVANAGPGYQIVNEPLEDADEAPAPAPDRTATVAPPDTLEPNVVTDAKSIYVDARYVYVEANRGFKSEEEALRLLGNLQYKLRLSPGSFSDAKIHDDTIVFRVNENDRHLNATSVAKLAANGEIGGNLMNDLRIVNSGTRKWADLRAVANSPKSKYLVLAFVVCGCVAGTVLAILAIYLVRRHSQSRQKLRQIGDPDSLEASKDYQDLCRQRMQSKASEKPEPLHAQGRVSSVASEPTANSPSSRSSTSSCYASTSRDAQLSEEPVTTNMDITTGHIILSYMEDHLQNKDRLHEEWDELSNYVPDLNQTDVASNAQNARQNRYADILPYDHSRVVLNSATNILDSDYINASTITDHDPRNPAYIATQGPLPHTVADFWQMIWEQGSVVIVMLTKLTENGNTMCHRYWPEEGSDLYHIYEVHLVSEHIWCDDYLVRSFYLKNLQTNETRTVTQFHFLTWPDLSVPSSAKALLDFRRKVNKSYKGRSCPIVVHCSDGAGRTGIYCLIDMVLSRMSKGAKEIDIAATLEHIRDQRMSMVKTKEQFEFALTAVAEEVHAILKALPQ